MSLEVRHCKNWKPSEINFLIQNFKHKKDTEIAKVLSRTVYGVRTKRHQLELKKFSIGEKMSRLMKFAIIEQKRMILINEKVKEMRSLIELCENENNSYTKERYKLRLKKLSGL